MGRQWRGRACRGMVRQEATGGEEVEGVTLPGLFLFRVRCSASLSMGCSRKVSVYSPLRPDAPLLPPLARLPTQEPFQLLSPPLDSPPLPLPSLPLPSLPLLSLPSPPFPSVSSSPQSSHRQPRSELLPCLPSCPGHYGHRLWSLVVPISDLYTENLGHYLTSQFPHLQNGVIISTSWAAMKNASHELVKWLSWGHVHWEQTAPTVALPIPDTVAPQMNSCPLSMTGVHPGSL